MSSSLERNLALNANDILNNNNRILKPHETCEFQSDCWQKCDGRNSQRNRKFKCSKRRYFLLRDE